MSTLKTRQPNIYQLFSKLLRKNTLQHAYLFEGAKGTGKKELSLWIAKSLFCAKPKGEVTPCGECYQCKRIETHQHPDVIEVEPDGLSIKIDQVRELRKEFSKSGLEGRQKIIIIEDAEKMTDNAANGLLKFIEEPEGDLTVFLLTSAKQNLLPTIISRCQVIQFKKQLPETRLKDLKEAGLNDNQAAILSKLTESNEEAVRLNEETNLNELTETVWQWFKQIIKKEPQAFIFVETNVMGKVNNREEYHLLLDLLLFVYKDLLSIYFKNEDKNIAFYKYKSDLEFYVQSLTSKKIAKSLSVILDAKKKLNSNVQAQGVFEDTALRLIEG